MEVYIVGVVVMILHLVFSVYFFLTLKRLKSISIVFVVFVRYSILIATLGLGGIAFIRDYFGYILPFLFSLLVFLINYVSGKNIKNFDLNMILVFVVLAGIDIFFKLNVLLPLSLAYFVVYSTYYFASKQYDNLFKKLVFIYAIMFSIGVVGVEVGGVFKILPLINLVLLFVVAFSMVLSYFIILISHTVDVDITYNSLAVSLIGLEKSLKEFKSKVEGLIGKMGECVDRVGIYSDKVGKSNFEMVVKEFFNVINEISPQVSFLSNLVNEEKEKIENVVKDLPFLADTVKYDLKSFHETQGILSDVNIEITNLTKIALDSEKAVANVSKSVKELRLVAKNLSEDLKTFSKVSDQSEMLSINISVESSKIGKQSSAFSKLAQQAKKFSDTISTSVSKIKSLIKELDTKAEFSEYTIKTLVMSFVEIETGLKSLSKKISDVLLKVQSISELSVRLESKILEIGKLSMSMPEFISDLTKILEDIKWNYKKLRKHSDDLNASVNIIIDSVKSIITNVESTFSYAKELFNK